MLLFQRQRIEMSGNALIPVPVNLLLRMNRKKEFWNNPDLVWCFRLCGEFVVRFQKARKQAQLLIMCSGHPLPVSRNTDC